MLEFSSTESCSTGATSTPLVGFSSNDSSCDGNVALMNDFESTEGCNGQGPQGPQGFSAYQIAVFDGFVGTEEEWLASLVGPGVPIGGTAGQILAKINSTNFNTQWINNTDLVGLTSVGISLPTGLTVSNSPLVANGVLNVTYQSGYSIPTTTSQTNWDTAYTNRITSGTSPLSIALNVISIAQANTSTNGYLSSTDWNTFNSKFNLPSLTSGSVLFSNGTTIAQDNSNFFWDNTNKRLGIGTNAPSYKLHNVGSSGFDNGNSGDAITILNAGFIQSGLIRFRGFSTQFILQDNAYNTKFSISTSGSFSSINTGGNFGIATTTDNGGKLQIKVGGAASTDIALRIRNSGDTADILKISGDNLVSIAGRIEGRGSSTALSFGTQGANVGVLGALGANLWSLGYSVSPDTVQFSTIAWNSSGNVGIGTTSPTATLHVKGSGATSATTNLLSQNSSLTTEFRVKDDGVVRIQTTANGYTTIGQNTTNGSTPVIYAEAYAVQPGIAKFYNNNSASTAIFSMYNGSYAHTLEGYYSTAGAANTSVLGLLRTFEQTSGTSVDNMLAIVPTLNLTGTRSGSTIRGIYYNPTVTSLTGTTHRAIETVTGDVIFGSTSGNVGIGTTTPAYKLDVSYNTLASGNGTANITAQVKNGSLYFDNISASAVPSLIFNAYGTNFVQFWGSQSAQPSKLYIGGSPSLTVVPTTPLMTWDVDNNRVGIGTTAPTGKLEVLATTALPVIIGDSATANFGKIYPDAGGNLTILANGGSGKFLWLYGGNGSALQIKGSYDSAGAYNFISNNYTSSSAVAYVMGIHGASIAVASVGTGTPRIVGIDYTINNTAAQTGTATGIFLNATETALNGMAHNLMDLQVGGVSKFKVKSTGFEVNAINPTANIIASNINGSTILSFSDGAYNNRLIGDNSYFRMETVTNSPLVFFTNSSEKFRISALGLLQLQGTTNLFPAIKRNAAGIDFRLADDSGFCNISTGNIASGNISAGNITTGPGVGIGYDSGIGVNIGSISTGNGWKVNLIDNSNNIYGFFSWSGSIISDRNASGRVVLTGSSAMLELQSTTKGFLPPRMTNAQRLAIVTPAVGLIVYCTDVVEGLYINKSTGWTFIA